MKLTKKSETSTKITFTYDRPMGPVEGYLYYAGGVKVSRTFNPNDLEVTFGKVDSDQYAVEAVGFTTIARANWPDTPIPPTDLPFPEADLRPGFVTLKPAAGDTMENVKPLAAGQDVLVDLQNLERTAATFFYGKSGQRVKVINGRWNIPGPLSSGAYRRGGPRIRSSDGVGPEHISFTDCRIKGIGLADSIAVDAGMNTKVTVQRTRIESRWALDHQDSPEPAEHCDSFQVQGNVGPIQIGLCTVWCQNIAAPNEGGKCFMLKKEGDNDTFTVDLKKVNMRGGGRTGVWFFQDSRDIVVSLENVWANDDGVTTGPNWNWSTSGGGMFYPNASVGEAIAWTRSGVFGAYMASWPAAAGVTGFIRQGLPSGGDYVPA